METNRVYSNRSIPMETKQRYRNSIPSDVPTHPIHRTTIKRSI